MTLYYHPIGEQNRLNVSEWLKKFLLRTRNSSSPLNLTFKPQDLPLLKTAQDALEVAGKRTEAHDVVVLMDIIVVRGRVRLTEEGNEP